MAGWPHDRAVLAALTLRVPGPCVCRKSSVQVTGGLLSRVVVHGVMHVLWR
jgi:hypothetical protein